jgi:hypothetical protein
MDVQRQIEQALKAKQSDLETQQDDAPGGDLDDQIEAIWHVLNASTNKALEPSRVVRVFVSNGRAGETKPAGEGAGNAREKYATASPGNYKGRARGIRVA